MALKFVTEPEGDTNYVTATARLCLTEDDRLVPDTDTDARWLFCVPGARIPRAKAERYGLLIDEPVPEPDSEPDSEQDPDGDQEQTQSETAKARRAVPNKARSRAANKGE